ncbi:MAG: hypothetical protein IJB83_00060 [Bacilli bacterium]|nr:hypothetical protein [Bacilli bacterium]
MKTKKNIFISLFILSLILSICFVVSRPVFYNNNLGSLMYSIKINGDTTSSVKVPSGETEYMIEIVSLNNVNIFYKLVYEMNDNISISYKKDLDRTSGVIDDSKKIVLKITNSSSIETLVNFDVVIGSDIEKVIIPKGYLEIKDVYKKNYFNQVALFVDGKEVSSLDNKKNYTLTGYECNNGETVEWRNNIKGLYIYPITSKTGCNVHFEESKILHEIILADYNGGESDANIDFSAISSNTNGKGLYYTSDTSLTEDYDGDGVGDRVYYYRGNVENNYLYFASKCWRMVRIVEDGSVRLKYGGAATIGDDGSITCPQTGTNVTTVSSQKWDSAYTDNRYVGFMYGSSCSSYANCHTNYTNSSIKSALRNWYSSNIENQTAEVKALIKDSVYCNDRSLYSGNGYSTNVTLYGAWGRLFVATKKVPTYKCSRADDKFTQSASVGNGKNDYPIGLLTADEVAFAGGVSGVENKSYFMYINKDFYTMSPAHFNGIGMSAISQPFIVRSTGALLSDNSAGISYGLLPVISIDKYAEINSGSGVYNDPYVINPNE